MKCLICKEEMQLKHKSVIEFGPDDTEGYEWGAIKSGITETWWECNGSDAEHPPIRIDCIDAGGKIK